MQKISINIQEPYLSLILSGKKIVEGRLNKGKFAKIKIGDIILIETIDYEVVAMNNYPTFKDMIVKEGLENVIPDKKSIKDAVNVYYKFYTKQQEQEYGVVAIQIKKLGN